MFNREDVPVFRNSAFRKLINSFIDFTAISFMHSAQHSWNHAFQLCALLHGDKKLGQTSQENLQFEGSWLPPRKKKKGIEIACGKPWYPRYIAASSIRSSSAWTKFECFYDFRVRTHELGRLRYTFLVHRCYVSKRVHSSLDLFSWTWSKPYALCLPHVKIWKR